VLSNHTGQVGVVRRVDEVMRQRLVHVIVQFQSGRRHYGVIGAHQVFKEAIETQQTPLGALFVRLEFPNQVFGSVRVGVRMQDFIKSRISLGAVQEVDELIDRHEFFLARSASPVATASENGTGK